MWNLTIFDENNFSSSLSNLQTELCREVENLGVIIEIAKDKKAIFLRADDKYLNYVRAIVKQLVAECVVEKYKPIFFEEQLNLKRQYDLNGIALLKTICCLDRADDVAEVKRNIVLGDEFHINSFWLFGLEEIKKRWQDVCDVIHINMLDIASTNAFVDIIKYLLKLSEKNCVVVNVVDSEKEILFFNENGENVLGEPILQTDSEKDSKVVGRLIELCPTYLEWEGKQNEDLKNFVLDIFNG